MSGSWKQGLCNCCGDCGVCMCGLCCEPCLVYRNAEALNKSGLLCCVLGCFFPCVPALLLRNEARDKYNIEGSTCGDVGAAVCCPLCVQCQVGVEIQDKQPGA